jgi:ATP-binding cassette subfamily B protein
VTRKAPEPESEQRPLDFRIVQRLFRYTTAHARLRNVLTVLVVLRAIQLPLLAWAIAAIISGPIAHRDARATTFSVLGLLAFAAVTELCFVFRSRCALLLGELVVRDLRNDIYAHLLRLPIGFFKRTQVGRLIGRITSDVDVVRVGVQDVAFVTTVQAGNMVVSAILMLYYDWKLFLVVLVMAQGLWT